MTMVNGFDGFLFDMDGTLIDAHYDWPHIREQLGVTGRSLIDELNDMPEPVRSERWRWIEAYEKNATQDASLRAGVHELLELLRAAGVRTALITNNNDANTAAILKRFALAFDCVLTRDSGFWKPSGDPFVEAMRQLQVKPDRCMAVGDSRHDVHAARAVGCARLCLLHEQRDELGDAEDLRFADIPAFTRYLRGLQD
jgi:HAD superfamily hydrolase (TIGR01509 family)